MTRAGSARPGRGRLGRLWWVALAALCGACGIVESYRIAADAPLPASGTPCASALGSYSLPKAHLQVVITRAAGKPPEIQLSETRPVKVVRHPDPVLTFCLDHLASAFARDNIKIEKWPFDKPNSTGEVDQANKTSFLGAVSINALDETSYIVNALVRSLFILVSGDVGFAPRSAEEEGVGPLADLEYDPFNPLESAGANRRLTQLGYCLVLESYTYDRSRFSVDQYCDAPERYGSRLGPVSSAYLKAEATPANPHIPGLMYRPRHPYRLAIFRKRDPKGPGRWQLAQTTFVELENLSPVLSLAVERTAFGERTVNFIFNEGTLLTACVSKTSEIEGFVEIPLEIARSIVELPGAIFKVRINQFGAQKDLVDVQKQLYQVQQAYLQAMAPGQKFTSVPGAKTTFTRPADPLANIKATATPGLMPREKTLAYGNDLFGVDLAALCGGKRT